MLATRGCLPFRRVEGNTQSPTWEYVVFCFPAHKVGEQRMEWHRALRRFALRQTYLATRPSTTHVDHSVSEIDVMPFQAQAFGYTETCAGGQRRHSAFRFSEVTHDCIRLFRGENHRFVSTGRLAADKAHGVRLLVSRN